MKRGQDSVEKGKRNDERNNFLDALKYYEVGAELLLEAANRTGNDGHKSEAIRFKCLLIHERIETIRNHLEHGAPICDRRDTLNTFEVSLNRSASLGCAGGFDSCSASPEPLIEESEEDRALLMEEVRSNLSMSPSRRDSLGSSRHSLYPTICEIKQSPINLSEENLVGSANNGNKMVRLVPWGWVNWALLSQVRHKEMH